LFSCAVAPSAVFAVVFDLLLAREDHLNSKPSFFQLPEALLPSSAATKPASATLGQKKVAIVAGGSGGGSSSSSSSSSSASGGPELPLRLPRPRRPASV